MATRRVEVAFDGQAVDLGANINLKQTVGNGNHIVPVPIKCPREATPGKTTIMAIGRAVPEKVVKNDGLADQFIEDFNLKDPVVQAKLRRLCEMLNPFT